MARQLIALMVLAGLAVGCGDDPELDVAALEDSIVEALLPAIVEGISCPSPLAVETRRISCIGSLGGVSIDISVGIEAGADADIGALASVGIDAPLLDVDEVVVDAAARLTDDLGVEVAVDCPASVVVIEPDAILECAATDLGTGTVRLLEITLLDVDGSWEMDLFG